MITGADMLGGPTGHGEWRRKAGKSREDTSGSAAAIAAYFFGAGGAVDAGGDAGEAGADGASAFHVSRM